MLKSIEKKGDVQFFIKNNGDEKIQRVKGIGDLEVENDKRMKYIDIRGVKDYIVKYNLNGLNGFSIWLKTQLIEDDFWDIDKACAYANNLD